MTEIPPEWELIEMLGTDVRLLEPAVPLSYNTIMLTLVAEDLRGELTVIPSYEQCIIRVDAPMRISVRLDGVQSVRLFREGGTEGVLINTASGAGARLSLRPQPAIDIRSARLGD